MTSKLKCPFCGKELYSSDNCYVCLNDDCIFCGFHFMEKRWKPIIELKQALIQAKQDLEIARKALGQIAELALAHDDISIADEVVGVFDALNQQDFADKIREQINHIADASKMVGQN